MNINNSEQIRHVLVVGGGTAGWLTACHLAKKLGSNRDSGVKITLVESENIPSIGVGEGTVPAIRQTLQYLGISEADFVRECDATFKQGIKFTNWLHSPETHGSNYYHHVFDYPESSWGDVGSYWLLQKERLSYVDTVSIQGRICDLGLGPKDVTMPEFVGATSYAYHLDAAKLAVLLTRHAVDKLGVRHLLADVEDVKLEDGGNISSVVTDKYGEIKADLFVDCTGFSSLLLGKGMGVEFVDKSDVLFADYALAAQIPYADSTAPIPSYTISAAQESGWIWDIGLSARRGTGYVYSSAHTDHERAETVFRNYLGDQKGALSVRKIPMRVGHRQKYWHKNCVAIGLSQGFVEPLEATGILIYDATARMLADTFPADKSVIHLVSKQFNERVQYAWDKVVDFIKLHYCISERRDHPFWIDNCDAATIPDSLQEKLELWRYQPPTDYDFPSKLEVFNLSNYQYVLYGMEYPTLISPYDFLGDTAVESIERRVQDVSKYADKMASILPVNRVLIDKIKRYGLQKI